MFWEVLPIEIYHKLINYGIYEPPHFIAYKTAQIRPIFSCELNCKLSGTIEIPTLEQEWDRFIRGD